MVVEHAAVDEIDVVLTLDAAVGAHDPVVEALGGEGDGEGRRGPRDGQDVGDLDGIVHRAPGEGIELPAQLLEGPGRVAVLGVEHPRAHVVDVEGAGRVLAAVGLEAKAEALLLQGRAELGTGLGLELGLVVVVAETEVEVDVRALGRDVDANREIAGPGPGRRQADDRVAAREGLDPAVGVEHLLLDQRLGLLERGLREHRARIVDLVEQARPALIDVEPDPDPHPIEQALEEIVVDLAARADPRDQSVDRPRGRARGHAEAVLAGRVALAVVLEELGLIVDVAGLVGAHGHASAHDQGVATRDQGVDPLELTQALIGDRAQALDDRGDLGGRGPADLAERELEGELGRARLVEQELGLAAAREKEGVLRIEVEQLRHALLMHGALELPEARAGRRDARVSLRRARRHRARAVHTHDEALAQARRARAQLRLLLRLLLEPGLPGLEQGHALVGDTLRRLGDELRARRAAPEGREQQQRRPEHSRHNPRKGALKSKPLSRAGARASAWRSP